MYGMLLAVQWAFILVLWTHNTPTHRAQRTPHLWQQPFGGPLPPDQHDAYQLTDHLGNVRAVIMKNGENAVSLTAKTDYYPFGMPMPNRNIEGNYRYGLPR